MGNAIYCFIFRQKWDISQEGELRIERVCENPPIKISEEYKAIGDEKYACDLVEKLSFKLPQKKKKK